MKNKKQNVILHGEAMLFPSSLPADAVEIRPTNDDFHIIADSETTGNHHVIDMVPSHTRVYQSGNRLFVKNTKKTQVRCVHANRHDAITLEPNVWEVDRQQEYDHFAQNLRAVRD